MSDKLKSDLKSGGKGTKTPRLSALLVGGAGNSKPTVPAFVPPVLREVGKLAAGVASVSTSNGKSLSSGSATGNPRNKVALQPGHSLMDWIRLGTSGKDLTGLGSRAGNLSITKQELAKHNKRNDAWLAIRGKVYNVTEYFPFHPGGVEELMRGAGIDATNLFDEVHPWVNYEQILQKCLIGKLVAIDPSIDAETLFFGEKQSLSGKSNRIEVSSVKSLDLPPPPIPKPKQSPPEQPAALPRFDWIQQLNCITLIFYTKAFSNPIIEVNPPVDDQNVTVTLRYDGQTFENELAFYNKIRWPCDIRLRVESGKVELVFRKYFTGLWENYGLLKQNFSQSGNNQGKCQYVLKRKTEVNYNTWLLKFDRVDGKRIIVPIGKHVRVFGSVDGQDISKSYTPVPESLFDTFLPHSELKDGITLMVKRYPDGRMSRFVTSKDIDESVEISKPLGNFDLNVVEKREIFVLLAGGTGITPMLNLIIFLLERRIKNQFLHLLFFNRTERDILFRSKLEDLQKSDERFRVNNILSESSDSWDGLKGRINAILIDNTIQEYIKDTGYTIKDIYCFVCGPPKFNEVAISELKKIHIGRDQSHVFEG
ncbi:cytochrome b5 reductase 4 isoform X2 [Anthonomus grandis grandis]|uniref:cytochrome b5 reductase 4 isoform X2 n=1 Tax=Anthonomus grandis grandis TaxID=2921223 RepID=UPI002165BAD7|nr:cytochrome b5 reductase 4 isoform X2 [Anthonomus grandis grandis]